MNPKDYPKTSAEVVRYFKLVGLKGVTLKKGKGWISFEGHTTDMWYDHTVNVPFLNYLTFEQWEQTFRAMESNPTNNLMVREAGILRNN